MPKEVTTEVRKNRHSPYPVPTSAAEPIQLEEFIKIRTGEPLRHRELCGNIIISRGRRKRSFRAEYRKCHAMKPTIRNYSRTKNKASVSLEQQAHGLVDRDILLTGGEKNIIKMFHVGAADCVVQRLGSSAGAILSSTSDVSCVKLLTSAREVADSDDVSASVTVIDISGPLDFIKELTERAWICTEKKNRRTLQRDGALWDDDLFSFLHNTVTMPQEATDDDDDEESPPPPEEEAANDVVQQIYFPEPYQYHSADHPLSYPMNTSNINPFEEGSSSSAANNPPAIDPRIAYGLNLQIGGEMPLSYHRVAPQPPCN